ncbi:hypothetical protein ACXET9_12430 [Brachybacterium sp. DNPG3]
MDGHRNHDHRDDLAMTDPARGVRGRALAAAAALALAGSLLAGCGSDAADEADTGTTTVGQGEDATTPEEEGTASDGADDATDDDASDDDAAEDDADGDDTTDDDVADDATDDAASDDDDADDADDAGDDADDGSSAGTVNLFEGSWGFGHDTKVLTSDELADVVEEAAEERGPAEMSLEVECQDGVDTAAGDDEAECIAFADEGVQHLWSISVGPADSGLEIEVTNG